MRKAVLQMQVSLDGFTGRPEVEDKGIAMENKAVIDVRDLVKVYRGGTRAVDRVTFQVAPGELFGFLGPNGAGGRL